MKEQGFSAETGEQTGQESLQGSLQGSFLERHSLSLADVVLQGDAQEGTVVLPLPANLSLGQGGLRFVREGDDLVIESGMASGMASGMGVVVEGYFTATPPPVLTTAMGGDFSPSFVGSFLEQGSSRKYALGEIGGWIVDKIGGKIGNKIGNKIGDSEKQVIGEIVSLEGEVQVVRYGVMITLKMGDKIFEGDIVSTGKDAEVFMRFTDKMEFRLGEDARLAIDEYLYDEVNSSGLQALSIIAGAFSYASGLIGGADPDSVRLQTPYGVIGIRGTKILGAVRDEELSVTVLEGSVALLRDGREAALLDEPFETLNLSLKGAVPRVEIEIASVERVLREYDLLDNSEQQLRALESGKPLEDEISAGAAGAGAGDVERVVLSGGDEVYIEPVLAVAETSFLSRAERNTVGEVSAENEASEQSFVVDDDEIVEESAGSAAALPVPSAGELSFEGSSVGVRFDFSGSGDFVFADDAGVVFRHGSDVSLVRQDGGSEGRYEFVVTGVADVTGSVGEDYLTGDGAANRLVGGAGADTLSGDAGDDALFGGDGNDKLYGGLGNDVMLNGGAGTDRLEGGAGNDRLFGGVGTDTLLGGDGEDKLYGGAGNDILEGGAGLDRYIFRKGDGADSVTDVGGHIIFEQDDSQEHYTGATYTFTRADGGRSEVVTLTVEDRGGTLLNTIEFTNDFSTNYVFCLTSGNACTEIPVSSLVVPPRVSGGSASPPLNGVSGTDWVSYARSSVDAYEGAGFTINIEFGGSKVADADAFWHGLTT